MKKTVFTVLYLMVATTVVFYWPKIVSSLGNDGGAISSTLAQDADMPENAYFALREVASVQLGFVLISYEVDAETGICRKRFSNAACSTSQGDAKQLVAERQNQEKQLHEQVLLLVPVADDDHSGSVSEVEGVRFRDLFEFGHLAANCFNDDETELNRLAKAMNLDLQEIEKSMSQYQRLKNESPEEIRMLFP